MGLLDKVDKGSIQTDCKESSLESLDADRRAKEDVLCSNYVESCSVSLFLRLDLNHSRSLPHSQLPPSWAQIPMDLFCNFSSLYKTSSLLRSALTSLFNPCLDFNAIHPFFLQLFPFIIYTKLIGYKLLSILNSQLLLHSTCILFWRKKRKYHKTPWTILSALKELDSVGK